MMKTPQIGHFATDKISGFSGIITGCAIYLTGCWQYLVYPKSSGSDYKEPQWFDELRLDISSDVQVDADVVARVEASMQKGADRAAPKGSSAPK